MAPVNKGMGMGQVLVKDQQTLHVDFLLFLP